MYMLPLKAGIVEALRATFNGTYPEADFQNLWCSIEFPVEQASYPGIWVTYEDTDEVRIAGVSHVETVVVGNQTYQITRGRFGGTLTLTIVALSSLERDRIYDEVVRTILFARQEPEVSAFKSLIESNDLIAMNLNFDVLKPSGDAAAPGTPWGTDEMVYEKSISLDVLGEFVSTPSGDGMYLLREVLAEGYPEYSPEPAFPDHPTGDTLDPGLPGYPDDHFEVVVDAETIAQQRSSFPATGGPPFTRSQWH
jgi:hypothetical protein